MAGSECDNVWADVGLVGVGGRFGDTGGQFCVYDAGHGAGSGDSAAECDVYADGHVELQPGEQPGECDGEQGQPGGDGVADGQCDCLRPDVGLVRVEWRVSDAGGQF